MPSANLELVRSIYAAWERGDYGSADWADPEIEYVVTDGPSPGSWTGPAGLAQGTRDWLSAFEGFCIEADEYRELDDQHVLVFMHYGGRGRTSGLNLGEIGSKGLHLFQVRDGKVTKLVRYLDRERALAGLGLAPETGSGGA